MKLCVVLAFAAFVAITEASKNPAFSHILDPVNIDPAPAGPPSSAPHKIIKCACADQPGIFADTVNSIADQLKTVSSGLNDLGKDLATAGKRRASNEALATADDAAKISQVLEASADGKADEILTLMKGVNNFVSRFTEVMQSTVAAEAAAGEDVGTNAGAGTSLVPKLNGIANGVSVIEALTNAVGSIASKKTTLH